MPAFHTPIFSVQAVSDGLGSGCQGDFSQALENIGLTHLGRVYRNLPVPEVFEHALRRGEGALASNGALCVLTGKYTGRSPQDRFIVDEPSSSGEIHWDANNRPIAVATFEALYCRIQAYVQGRDLYCFDGYVGADPAYRQGVRVITELASHSLFAQQLLIRPQSIDLENFQADFTVIAIPGLKGVPARDAGLHSEAFILLHLARRLVIIGGTRYAGEIKKSVFSLMNYFMTKCDVLPMHCSANVDDAGNTALFFGLSGTGKTTLSADPERRLIGDDEHGWSPSGIFNFEGGCYAKTIRLSQAHEPDIWNAIRFGALLENVPLNPRDRQPDYDDASLTENTRAGYPLHHIARSVEPSVGDHPQAVILLTADAFGVLPPIARLSRDQAVYHFLSGYTSKLAGTERGVTQPQATFSACFGKPFLPLPATLYADMLGRRLDEQKGKTAVYLVNTGWSGGTYGVGTRIPIHYTRAMVKAALSGVLDGLPWRTSPIFNLQMPEHLPGVPAQILDPRRTWLNAEAYDCQAQALAQKFIENFHQFETALPKLARVGPRRFS